MVYILKVRPAHARHFGYLSGFEFIFVSNSCILVCTGLLLYVVFICTVLARPSTELPQLDWTTTTGCNFVSACAMLFANSELFSELASRCGEDSACVHLYFLRARGGDSSVFGMIDDGGGHMFLDELAGGEDGGEESGEHLELLVTKLLVTIY